MLFCSQTDTFGQVLLEAQASGLPVVAVGVGGPAELIDSGRSGVLCPPDRRRSGRLVARLAASPVEREELARGGLAAVRDRTWDAALGRLADGWRRALAAGAPPPPCARPDLSPVSRARGELRLGRAAQDRPRRRRSASCVP